MTSNKSSADAALRAAETRAANAESELASLKAKMPTEIANKVRREVAGKVAQAEQKIISEMEGKIASRSDKDVQVSGPCIITSWSSD